MKKILLILFVLLLLTSCSSNEVPILSFNSDKYITLPDYSTYLDYDNSYISNENLNSIISMELSLNNIFVPITDRDSLQDNDIAIIDICISEDNDVLYEELNLPYYLGSNVFTEEFESILMAVKVGNSIKFDLIFPEEFQNKTLCNKKTDVSLTLHSINRNVEIADEDVILSYYNCSSMGELYIHLKAMSKGQAVFYNVVEYIFNNITIENFPPQAALYRDSMVNYYRDCAQQEGMSYEEYTNSFLYCSPDDIENDIYSNFVELMIMKAISEDLGIRITIDDYNIKCGELAAENGITIEQLMDYTDEFSICYELLFDKICTAFSLSHTN